MAEAMALETLAMGTGYSGNLSFMTEDNSVLVPYDIVPVPPFTWPYPAGAPWAEARLDAAASLMRRAVTDEPWRTAKIAQATHDVIHVHNIERTAAFVHERLQSLHHDFNRAIDLTTSSNRPI
jgi:hypothetical protein